MAILRTPAAAAARQLSQALLSAADARHSWTPSHEQAAHHFLCRHHCRPSQDGSSGRRLLTPPLVAATIDPHLLPHPPLALGLFHWASQQPGFTHTPQSYQSLLRSLSLSRRPTSLVNALSRARAEGVSLPPSSVFLAAKSLLLCRRTLEAFGLVEQFSKSGSSCDGSGPEVYNSLLAACSDDGRWDMARKLFEEMTRSGVSFNDVGFGVFINGICGNVGLDETLRLVERMKAHAGKVDGSIVAALVMDGLSRAGRIEETWRALEELRNRGCKPDFIAYRTVAEEFRKAGRVDDAWKILKQKRKFGVAPRADYYKEYILLLISERQVRTAKKLGEAIVDGCFPIDHDVLNALVGSVAAVDPTSATSFCMYMIGKEMLPTHLTLSNLSRNLCKQGKSDEMWEIFRILLSKDYFQDVGSYNLVVSFLCRAGRVREAYDVLKEMKKRGFAPDVTSYNFLMEACCREDLLRPAKKLWDEMFASGCPGNPQTYNTLISKFSEMDVAEEAFGLFHHMVGKGVTPDETTYTSLIKVLCQVNRTDDACEVFHRSLKQDPVLGSSVLGTLVLRLCGAGNFPAASRLICDLPPHIDNTSSHVLLLKGLADAGHVDKAVEHAEWVRDNIPTKLQRILDELVASLSTAPKLEVFLQLLQEMCQRGLLLKVGPWVDLCSNT
ncbi:hypothetical protein Taro_035009 [Colocasia esculenta]|uniref:Pentatricopeptide repeat-containing protein n=1 Tax=Colocasia esculenta TaxID=4460 RepID=A0A843W5G7_COLES|nr:hypothetical protein [Colocasia esculenta]